MNDLNSLDKSNFRQFILGTPSQFETGMNLAKNIKLKGDFNSIVVSGMGGSALPANLLKTYCENFSEDNNKASSLKIYINRYYSLPKHAIKENFLHFVASYSGNTEETLFSLEEIKRNNLPFIGFSSGGKLEELCKKYNAPHVKLPVPYPNYQPRMGTGYFFGSMLQILINQGLVDDVSEQILLKAKGFNDLMDYYENKGKELAKKLFQKTPVIYASLMYKPVAMIWKIKLNENAKTPAFWNFFPELNHNEMVGFTNPQAKFFIVMLKDNEDNPKNINRYELTASLLKEKGIESEIIDLEGNDVFSKMFSSIIYSDWTSYHLALMYNQDPTPVEMVEKLKKMLVS